MLLLLLRNSNSATSHAYVPTGQLITVSGTAVASTKFVYSPSGTIKVSGTDVVSKKLKYVPTGQRLNLAGTGNFNKKFVWSPSGQILKISGVAADKKTFKWTSAGSTILISGSATTSLHLGSIHYTYTPTGQIIKVFGVDTVSKKLRYVPSGQLVRVAGTDLATKKLSYSPTGVIRIAGTVSGVIKLKYVPSGQLIKVSGTDLVTKKLSYAATGLIKVSGTVIAGNKFAYSPTGLIKVAGVATTAKTTQFLYHPAGVISVAGTSRITKKLVYAFQSGLLRIAASSVSYSFKKSVKPTGQLLKVAGTATTRKAAARTYSPVGTIRISGNVNTATIKLKYQASGTISVAGAAAHHLKIISTVKSGLLRLSGTGSYRKTFAYQPLGHAFSLSGGLLNKKISLVWQASGAVILSGQSTISKKITFKSDGLLINLSNSIKNYGSFIGSKHSYVASGGLFVYDDAKNDEGWHGSPLMYSVFYKRGSYGYTTKTSSRSDKFTGNNEVHLVGSSNENRVHNTGTVSSSIRRDTVIIRKR